MSAPAPSAASAPSATDALLAKHSAGGALRNPLLWLVAAAVLVGAAAFGVYWLVTTPARIERNATDALIATASLEHLILSRFGETPKPLQLQNNKWAKQMLVVDQPRWDMRPTSSNAYPYAATITIPYVRYATIYHDSQEEAEADAKFYKTVDDDSFYADASDVATWRRDTKSHLVIELVYDSSSSWRERSRKTMKNQEEQ